MSTSRTIKKVFAVAEFARIGKRLYSREFASSWANMRCGRSRQGISAIEVLVSLTLLVTVLSCSTVLIVRHGRMLAAQRHYRSALDELSNQLDRITGLPADQVPESMKKLTVSPFTAERLAGAKLEGELKPGDVGQRVMLRMMWKEETEQTVALAGWVFPRAQDTTRPVP